MNIKKNFREFTLDIQLTNTSRRLGLLGASGSGKSMTLKCIAGIETPDEGSIVFSDRVLFDKGKHIYQSPGMRNIGYMFQNYALFPHMTILENIAIGIRNKQDRRRITDRMLTVFRLGELRNRYPNQISGGEQQRVALARILAYEPELLLMDEPFSALDSFLKDQLQQELFESLQEYPGDIIMVSHSRDELYKFCQNIAIIDRGRILTSGNVYDIFHNPVSREAARLTGCKNIVKVSKTSDYEVYVHDWKFTLKTKQYVEESIRYLGIRAQDIRIGTIDGEDNTLPVMFRGLSEGYKENILVFSSRYNEEELHKIWWIVTKQEWSRKLQEQIPDSITFPKEHLLLLK